MITAGEGKVTCDEPVGERTYRGIRFNYREFSPVSKDRRRCSPATGGEFTRSGVIETAIRQEAREFDFEALIGGRTITRTYTYDKVEAVTINGKRITPAGQNSRARD